MYWIYVIKSKKTNNLYFGFTSDLESRLKSHNSSDNISTKFGTTWEIIYCEGYKSEKDARLREKKFKHYGNARTYVKSRLKNSLID